MKKVFIIILLVFSTTILCSDDLIASVSPEIIAINADLPNLLKKLAENAGHNLTVIEQPAGRSLEHFKNEDHHIELRIPGFGQEYDFVTAIELPVIKLNIKAFVNKSLGITGIKDLAGKKFVSVHGLAINDVITAKIPDLKQNLLRDFNAVPKYVAAGRSDFFVMEKNAGLNFLKVSNTEGEITMLQESILEIPLFVFIHNNKSHVIDDLKPVLEKMIQEGKFN